MSLHQTSGRWRLGLALALTTTVLWGILPIALLIALQALDAYTVIWFRFLLAFGLLAGYLGLQGQFPNLKQVRWGEWRLLAIAAFFLALNYIFYLQGLAHTSPANAQVLSQLSPVLLGLAALVCFKERYSPIQWLGLAVLMLGFGLFFNAKLHTLIAAPAPYLMGSSLLVLGSAAWAIYALAQKQLLRHFPLSPDHGRGLWGSDAAV